MNYISGETIRTLREQQKLTQAMLAEKMNVSDKTISKWETGRGYPDISIVPILAVNLNVSIAELMTGKVITNRNQSGNMNRSRFYVCPVCGNVIHALGEGAYSCHGIQLPVLDAETADEEHIITVEPIENEYYITMDHPMTKQHYISFAAYVTTDEIQLKKLYPEQDMQLRFTRKGHGTIYIYCTLHGLIAYRV